jgi:hypothetical protein
MADRIFVSYSHQDAALVTPVVRLLRSTSDFVFHDTDSIKPGSRWRGALADAIRDANLVIVFWCLHANESSEVEKEYLAAIEAAKNILPVLLDSTPVPPALGEFQWVDFRQLVQHGRLEPAAPSPAAPSVRRRSSWLAAAAGFAALVVALSVWTLSGGIPSERPSDQAVETPAVEPVEPVPPPIPPNAAPSIVEPPRASTTNVAWVLVVTAFVLALLLLRHFRRASVLPESLPDPGSLASPTAHAAMATRLAREIHQRLTPDRVTPDAGSL